MMKTQKHTHIEIINVEIQGTQFKQIIVKHYLAKLNILETEIETIKMYAYEDLSGIDCLFESGIYLKNGVKVKFLDLQDDKWLYETLTTFSQYRVLYKSIESEKVYDNSDNYFNIDECTFNVFLIKGFSLSDNLQANAVHLQEIINYLSDVNFSVYHSVDMRDFFYQQYGKELLSSILSSNATSIISNLIFENNNNSQVRYQIAHSFISSLVNPTEDGLALMKQIMSDNKLWSQVGSDAILKKFPELTESSLSKTNPTMN